ncbi:hypothetical protein [Antarcticibacterium sp. 1MA-6-2]|nr:hypothetical protein [Antarcticibacterium sp. 1MA-6-2]
MLGILEAQVAKPKPDKKKYMLKDRRCCFFDDIPESEVQISVLIF